jgi:hypothetical protein
LIDLPGVNAQERTREELLESLRIGAEDMLLLAAGMTGRLHQAGINGYAFVDGW